MSRSAPGKTSGGQQEERGGGDASSRVAQCIDKQHGFPVVLIKTKRAA